MAIVINGSGTVTGVTNVGSAAANTPVVMQDSGSDTAAIVAEKQRLRDVTKLADTATTLDELKSITV